MKSLLDFVVCCRGTNTRTSETKPPASEETRSLVVATSAPVRRPVLDRKRRNLRSVDWRPSLSAILEDNLSPERERRVSSAGTSERILRRKISSSAPAPAPASRYRPRESSDYRKFDHPMVIPVFAPTFWF